MVHWELASVTKENSLHFGRLTYFCLNGMNLMEIKAYFPETCIYTVYNSNTGTSDVVLYLSSYTIRLLDDGLYSFLGSKSTSLRILKA